MRKLEELRASEACLVAAAQAAGLATLRPRSLPGRVRREAHGFVDLLAIAHSRHKGFGQAMAAAVDDGAFACAAPEAIADVLDLWRGVVSEEMRGSSWDGIVDRVSRGVLHASSVARVSVDVVAIGGSSGSLSNLRVILASLDDMLPATVLIVVHRTHDPHSQLPLVLGRWTQMPVRHALDGDKMMLGSVLVAPTGSHLMVVDDRLRLSDAPRVSLAKPSIDVLFESAARGRGARLVCMLVSGTGKDGVNGMLSARQTGAVTLAIEPGEAQFGILPAAAIAAGAVAQVLGPSLLGPRARDLVKPGTA